MESSSAARELGHVQKQKRREAVEFNVKYLDVALSFPTKPKGLSGG